MLLKIIKEFSFLKKLFWQIKNIKIILFIFFFILYLYFNPIFIEINNLPSVNKFNRNKQQANFQIKLEEGNNVDGSTLPQSILINSVSKPEKINNFKNIIYKSEKDLTSTEAEKMHFFFKSRKEKIMVFEEKEKNNNLKLIGYRTKLNKHLMVSIKIALGRASQIQQQLFSRLARKISFFLEINKQGSIKNFMLTESSGFDEFDDFFKEIIFSAVPFPHIPNHLEIESFIFNGINNIL